MILLLGLICSLWGEPARCLQNEAFNVSGDIRQVTVSTDAVYIATEEQLHQLSHDLVLTRSLTLRGFLKEDQSECHRVSEGNATLSINVLLPFLENQTLISCGLVDNSCGFCEVLDLKDISKLVHGENIQVGPPERSIASVSFLVEVEKNPAQTETFILTATQHHDETVKLLNTHAQPGHIFSETEPSGNHVIRSGSKVEFVDGFQISSRVYLFSNVASDAQNNKVRLIWLEAKTSKRETIRSVRGATLRTSDGDEGSRLLASSVIPGGQQVLWSGVFSVDGGPTRTELLLFDISPDLSGGDYDTDPDFYYASTKPESVSQPKILKPKVVLFKKNYMVSLLAVKQKGWMIFFIGTADGKLIKLAVDRNHRPACPTELYRATGNQKVFPRLHLDPVDHKHIYVPFQRQIKRVPVTDCSTYRRMGDLWSAQDPYCVWCVSRISSTFEDDCKDSEWLSFTDEFQQKRISHRVVQDHTGLVKLIIMTHLTVEPKVQSNFKCQFSPASFQPCQQNELQSQFPQCSCILSDAYPANNLEVTVDITLGETRWPEKLKLTDCSNITGPSSTQLCRQCLRAGCGWRDDSCSWATEEVQSVSVCQTSESEMTLRPQISSISPSVVSVYGRNHAVLRGHNLSDVISVRIQTDLDCSPQESPVWNNTGVSLTFHIPRRINEAVAHVCTVLPDESCHGDADITYESSPSCFNILPANVWSSGNRKVTIRGTHLEHVEEVTHYKNLYNYDGIRHHYDSSEGGIPLTHIDSQTLTYQTPRHNTEMYLDVFVKVANETSRCFEGIRYCPDPEFITFIAFRTKDHVSINIQKRDDDLALTEAELTVWAVRNQRLYPCIMTDHGPDFHTCEVHNTTHETFNQLMIHYGSITVRLWDPPLHHQILLIVRLLLVPCLFAVLMITYQCEKRRVDKNKI